MSSVFIENITNSLVSIRKSEFGSIQIDTVGLSGNLADGILVNRYIEIKVRQRGTSPILLSAETNTTGSKVILTFDKKMSEYRFSEALYNDSLILNSGSSSHANIINEKVELIYSEDVPIEKNIDLYLSNFNNMPIESFDYGLLAPFENFPVKNNVIAPL